jgi:hypothetical protein
MSLIETFARGRFVVMRGFFGANAAAAGVSGGSWSSLVQADLAERGGGESSLVRPG